MSARQRLRTGSASLFSPAEVELLEHVNVLIVENGGWRKYIGTPLGQFLIETMSVEASRRRAPMGAGSN